MRLRLSLVPYLYTQAHTAYATGEDMLVIQTIRTVYSFIAVCVYDFKLYICMYIRMYVYVRTCKHIQQLIPYQTIYVCNRGIKCDSSCF